MSIRSYKQIYEQFTRMFPELAKETENWRGIVFKDKRIVILMKDGSVIHFQFKANDDWKLQQLPNGVAQKTKEAYT